MVANAKTFFPFITAPFFLQCSRHKRLAKSCAEGDDIRHFYQWTKWRLLSIIYDQQQIQE